VYPYDMWVPCVRVKAKITTKNIVVKIFFMPPRKIIIRVLTHRKKSFYCSKYEIQKYIFVFLPVTFGEGSGLPSLLIFRCILHFQR
jgi:hypothetical protein